MNKRVIFVLAFLFLGKIPEVFALNLKSGPEHVRLIEVYTAEAKKTARDGAKWVSKLASEKGLWREFVPIVFHVDPGPREVWKGSLMRESFTARQNTYAKKWGSNGMHLPTVVLDGIEWSGWAQDKAPPQRNPVRVGTLNAIRISPGELRVTFGPKDPTPKRWVAHAVLMGSGFYSKVEGGENIGQNFTHDFAVLRYASAPLELKREGYRGLVPLSEKTDVQTKLLYVAVWITQEESMIPVQAAGGKA